MNDRKRKEDEEEEAKWNGEENGGPLVNWIDLRCNGLHFAFEFFHRRIGWRPLFSSSSSSSETLEIPPPFL